MPPLPPRYKYPCFKGTSSIKSVKSTPSHNERDLFYLLVDDKLNKRILLVVLECLKDRAFHIKTVYVNSLDPSRGLHSPSRANRYYFIRACKRKRQRNRTSAMGKCGGTSPLFHHASHVISCAMFTQVCAARINYLEIS